MAIHGACGFRANKLQMEHGKLIVTSPMFYYEWPEQVVWAECNHGCSTDEDGHIISSEEHSCGIYSTTNLGVLSAYVDDSNYVPIVVEALGTYWFHWEDDKPEVRGLTSSGVQVAAVVKDFRNEYTDIPDLWIQALGIYYQVPLITLVEANALLEWAWNTFIPKEVTNEYNTGTEVPTAWVR